MTIQVSNSNHTSSSVEILHMQFQNTSSSDPRHMHCNKTAQTPDLESTDLFISIHMKNHNTEWVSAGACEWALDAAD
jgi:hypothetical protein